MRARGVYLLLLFINSLALASPGQEKWEFGTAVSLTSGDYGTGSDIDTLYMPFIFRRLYDWGSLDLVIPYVSVTSEGPVTFIQGQPNPTGRGKGNSETIATSEPTTESGLGDIVTRGRFYLIEEKEYLPAVDVIGRIKIPTANENSGLGTGEFDAGMGAELTKNFPNQYVGLAGAGYTFIGSSNDQHLRDRWNYDLGVGYNFSPELFGMVSFEEEGAIVEGTPNPVDLLFAATFKATPTFRLLGSVLFGLSDGSPDLGISAGIALRI